MQGGSPGARGAAAALVLSLTLGLVPSHASRETALNAQSSNAFLLAESVNLGPVAPETPLELVVILRNPAHAKQATDITATYSPKSPKFGQVLTAKQVAEQYGPSPETAHKLIAALRTIGLTATWQQGNEWVAVSGPAKRIESAFHVRATWYRSPHGTRYYAGDRDPVVPAVIAPYVREVGRLSNYFEPATYAVPAGGLAPDDLLGAYDITPLRKLGLDGTGETVAFFEFDGFSQQDLDTFTTKYSLPPIQAQIKAGPTFDPGGETEMDLEVVHEIAPGAKLVLYNMDMTTAIKSAKSDADVLQALLQLQTKMINENPGAILSQSWGTCEKPFGQALADAFSKLYDNADSLRESSFVSTGDNAAYECLRVSNRGTAPTADLLSIPIPSSVPGTTAVGGTRLSVSTNKGWYNETVWEDPIETNGTGGGLSMYFPRPAWQLGPGVVDQQLNPRGMRTVPDVSADADPMSGAAIYSSEGKGGGAWGAGGGTSQSAPIWAGIAALLNQYLKQKGQPSLGFANPALYHIAANANAYPAIAFHDIVMGNNLYYPATKNYDMATGLGTPDAWNLAQDLVVYDQGGGQ
jgi:subtilase family serine protease